MFPALTALLLLVAARGAAAQRPPSAELARQFGCESCGGALQFSAIDELAVADDGTIWVGDGQEPRIRAFTADGRSIAAFGRKGRGPGEIQGIERLLPDGRGGVRVVDMLDYRVTHLDSAGKPHSIVRLPGFPFDATAAGPTADVHVLLSQFRPGTATIRAARTGSDSVITVRGPITDFPRAAAPSELHSLAASPSSDLAVADGEAEYRIRVYRRDGTTHDITRTIPRPRRTAAEKEAARQRLGRAAAMRRQVEGRGAGRATPDVADEKPHFGYASLRFDPAGRLWVKTGRSNERQTVFDVFDASSAYLGEVILPARAGAWAPGRDILVSAGETDDGVPVVQVWRLR